MAAPAAVPQPMVALEKANRLRSTWAQAKKEIRAGRLATDQALFDPKLQGMRLGQLLKAHHRLGPARIRVLVARVGLHPMVTERRISALTDRQKHRLASAISAR